MADALFLPRATEAVIPAEKLVEYALNPAVSTARRSR